MENQDVAKIFENIADLLEIKGENHFRVRSYRNATRIIEGLPITLTSIIERDDAELEDIPGIGKGLHEKIVEIIKTGRCSFLDDLLKETSPGLLNLLTVPGVGPKKVKLIYDQLGIDTVDKLEAAAKTEGLRDLPGMGEKTEANIIKSIREMRARAGRYGIAQASAVAADIIGYLKGLTPIDNIQAAGSLRRGRETIGDIDILAVQEEGSEIMDIFISYPDVDRVLANGPTKSSIVLKSGIQVDLRVVEEESFGAALQYFTGSKAHNVALRDRAKRMGLKVSEYGVFREDNHEKIAGDNEVDVYRAVDLEWMPPELRESRGEIEAAEKNQLPDLISISDIRGDLHMHSTESDGKHTVEELVEYARGKGYGYIAVTDHSKAVGIAHGLDEKRVLKQIKEIDKVNAGFEEKGIDFRVFKGIEVDIKSDGSLDLDIDVLRQLDIVIGSVHSAFTQPGPQMTERIIKALSTGAVNILGHPTGRLIRFRSPYEVYMEEVFEAAKEYNVAMELNACPERLDLNDVHCRLAKEMAVKVVISTDAHNKLQMENMHYGIMTARRGWLEKGDVLNTKTKKELLSYLYPSRGH